MTWVLLGGTRSPPIGLTDDDHVAGASLTTNDETIHAVLWLDRKIRDLGRVPGMHAVSLGD
jgi:hypothetical protein